MTFIPDHLIPKQLRVNPWLRVMVALTSILLLLAVGLVAVFRDLEEFKRGPDYSAMHRAIAEELLDSADLGLHRFALIHGHSLEFNGKHFFDSIKEYVNPSDVYVYADSVLSEGDTITVMKPVGKHFDYIDRSLTYLAVGRKELPIIYRYIGQDSYLLYWVGENSRDEYGRGDDVPLNTR